MTDFDRFIFWSAVADAAHAMRVLALANKTHNPVDACDLAQASGALEYLAGVRFDSWYSLWAPRKQSMPESVLG